MRHYYCHIVLFLLTALLTACTATQPEPQALQGSGTLKLHLAQGLPGTRADETPENGYAFRNVLVIIANDAQKVIGKAYKEYAANVTEDVLSFQDLKVGSYQVVAYANIDHVAWQGAETIAQVEALLTADKDGGDDIDPDRELKTLTGSSVPEDPAQLATPVPMLMTGHKRLFVGVNENVGTVELLRPVTRLNVYLHNHTAYEVTLDQLGFTDFNASKTYLLDHRAGGYPQIPADNVYRPLPAYDGTHPVTVEAAIPGDSESGKALVYSQLLYENKYDREYRMFASLTLDFVDGDNVHTPISLDLSQEGVRRVTYSEIAEMEPGESKTVLLVNPNTKTGYFYGYAGTSLVYMGANYNFQETFQAKAEEILDNKQIRSYYCFTLSREADGRYQLKVGSKSIFGNEPFSLVEGQVPSYADYPVSNEFAGYLLRFRNSAGKYLVNNNKSVGTTSSNTDRGNCLWAVYEANPQGSALRLIDNETAQVTPLTCMLRNQELNVVMNIYYGEMERAFDFELDNAWWTTGHELTHIFK